MLGPIASYALTAGTPETRGTPFTVTVTALDAGSNTVTTDSSTTIGMTGSTGNVLFDANGDSSFNDNTITLTNGVSTVSTMDNYFETVTITATDSNSKTGNTSVTINPATGDFISRASGNWNTTTTWSNWNGTAWVNATTTPTNTTTGEIRIRTTNTVTNTASVSVALGLYILDAGGTNAINSGVTLTVGNGVANGIIRNGTGRRYFGRERHRQPAGLERQQYLQRWHGHQRRHCGGDQRPNHGRSATRERRDHL